MAGFSSAGAWLDQLFKDVFFQPDDALSLASFEKGMHNDTQVNVNGNVHPFEEYKAIVQGARTKFEFQLLSNKELLFKDIKEGLEGVSQHGKFVAKDKESGKTETQESVLIAYIEEKDGQRKLVKLEEITL